VIVGAHEIERGIEQTRFLQADEHGIGPVFAYPEPRSLNRAARGLPDSSKVSGMPTSERKRPPRSKDA